jgi:hypothetical protein
MVHCVNCGKEIEEAANYCTYCGRANRVILSHPAYPPYKEEKNPILIVIVVVVVIVLLQLLVSGALYLMVMGLGPSNGTPSVPNVVLSYDFSADQVKFTIISVSNEISLSNVWINLQTDYAYGGMTTGTGFPDGSDVSRAGINDRYWLSYYDYDGDRMLSTGDAVGVSSFTGPLPSGNITMALMNGQYGPTMGQSLYYIP